MMTAMLAAKNIIAGEQRYDVWAVNEDAEYHESGTAVDHQTSESRKAPAETALSTT